jgi:hypothetical protein
MLAREFGMRLKLKHCTISYVEETDMPKWGQLGCQGFIILGGSGNVVCQTTPAFMEVEGLAFKYVEMVLSSLLASKPIPAVGPGVPAHINDSQNPGHGRLVLCLTPENSDGECQVSVGRSKTLWIKSTSLIARGQEMVVSDCGAGCGSSEGCKNRCGNDGCGTADSCAAKSKEALATALEASAEKVTQACLAVSDGAHLPSDALDALKLQMVAAKKNFKAILADAKQTLEGDTRVTKLSLNGPCTNELCLCAVCECGTTCRCNMADVKDSDTCEKCVDFRAKKKAAAEAAS